MSKALAPWFGSRALAPWDIRTPRLFDRFRHEMDRLFEDFFVGEEEEGREVIFAPRTNVAETETEYEITVDLPGMKAEDVDVELKDGHLWITGERKCEKEEKEKTYHRIERTYGQFRRVIPLEEKVKPEEICAEYKDGVLRLTVPKHEASLPKKITVKS
jgi:HSP20 family protein